MHFLPEKLSHGGCHMARQRDTVNHALCPEVKKRPRDSRKRSSGVPVPSRDDGQRQQGPKGRDASDLPGVPAEQIYELERRKTDI